MLDGVGESARRAAAIVRNMLEFSRKSDQAPAPTDLNALLDKALELSSTDYDLKKKYDFRKIAIVRDYASGLPPISCNPGMLEQVFLNLLRNAAQAMAGSPPGTPQPRIVLRTRWDGDAARAEIEDNGPGMDEQTRRRAFEPFFTTKMQGEGTGLGLSVSYFIITNTLGGSIEVESQPGQGSKFIIRLPLGRERESHA
jgi:signal transduction histidine kinase